MLVVVASVVAVVPVAAVSVANVPVASVEAVSIVSVDITSVVTVSETAVSVGAGSLAVSSFLQERTAISSMHKHIFRISRSFLPEKHLLPIERKYGALQSTPCPSSPHLNSAGGRQIVSRDSSSPDGSRKGATLIIGSSGHAHTIPRTHRIASSPDAVRPKSYDWRFSRLFIGGRRRSGSSVRRSGIERTEESRNCHDAAHVDYHLWLVQSPGQKRSKSMVIEISPRMLDDHPDWPTLATTAWHKGHHVRISGWRTWDQEHHEQLTDRTNHNGTVTHASRATLWEIHPIHRIEVQAEDGSWVDIEEIDL